MALINEKKAVELGQIRVPVSKELALKFDDELKKYTKNKAGKSTLDFDALAVKLIAEISKLNSENPA